MLTRVAAAPHAPGARAVEKLIEHNHLASRTEFVRWDKEGRARDDDALRRTRSGEQLVGARCLGRRGHRVLCDPFSRRLGGLWRRF